MRGDLSSITVVSKGIPGQPEEGQCREDTRERQHSLSDTQSFGAGCGIQIYLQHDALGKFLGLKGRLVQL